MAYIPKRIRDVLMIQSDFSCCLCGQKFFCDIHHIIPVSENGGNDPSNLVVLCPTHHRHVHNRSITISQLKKMKMEHIEKVREAKKTRNHLSSIQESQIANLVHKKCIERNYDRENYLNMTGSELFFIVYDFNDVSLVVIPEDRAPLLISEQDILMLNSLEMVTNPFRMLFLKEFLNVDKMTFKQYYLVRLDVVSSIEDLTSSDLAYYGYEEFSNYREWIKGLILFSKA